MAVGVADVCSPAASQPQGMAECATFEVGKPAGSMIWAAMSRQAHSRRIVPVFWGISGWKSAICMVWQGPRKSR